MTLKRDVRAFAGEYVQESGTLMERETSKYRSINTVKPFTEDLIKFRISLQMYSFCLRGYLIRKHVH